MVLRSLRTISDRNIERVKALGGGIAVQNRMAFPRRIFRRAGNGSQQAKRTPPIRRMLEKGSVGAGTTQPAFRATTLTFPSTGLSPARPSGGSVFIRKRTRIGPGGSRAQALHHGEQLVFNRKTAKKERCSWQLARLGGSHWRLFFNSRRRDQASRIRYLRSWVGRSSMPAMILKTCAACTASEPRLVSCQRIWRYAKALNQTVDASHSAACSHVEGTVR